MSKTKTKTKTKAKAKKAGSGSKRGKAGKPLLYLEVTVPATQTLRVTRSSVKRDVPSLRKLDAATKKATGCGYELVVSKTMTVYLKPGLRAAVELKAVSGEDAIFEPETTTTTPSDPGG